MACNSCAKPFSLLRKEKGCPGCGFSYCSKCLDFQVFLPKLNAEVKVCTKCKNLSQKPDETKKVEAPDAYYRRIGALEKKQVGTSTGNLDLIDQEITARLQKLKEGRDPTPIGVSDETVRNRLQKIKGNMPTSSDAEIQARLAKLRGIPIQISSSKPYLPPPDTRTEEEQTNDLMKQYLEQTSIDTRYNDEFNGVISDIEGRMQRLKGGTSTPPNSKDQNVESEDEEGAVNKIVEKIKSEASLEQDELCPAKVAELPFCEICNDDAQMRCLGCRYLFCRTCFEEHRDDDDNCNRYESYNPPKNQNY
ncbi:unnamed protein product [Chrysodeixis includens]|uniref:FYVE-type domain-containing protein n=1 Tax=Chrysodeixis includens TaxID=689277 RepID=A0A9N8KV35_CHRIL|nr:unnamed protein product [Chrysodeixis includens]